MMGRELNCSLMLCWLVFSTRGYRKRKEILGGLKSVEEQGLVQFWTIILGTTITQGTSPPLDPCALHVCVCFDMTGTHVSRTCICTVVLNVQHVKHAPTN